MQEKKDMKTKLKEIFLGNLPIKAAALFSGFLLWMIFSMLAV